MEKVWPNEMKEKVAKKIDVHKAEVVWAVKPTRYHMTKIIYIGKRSKNLRELVDMARKREIC